MDLVLNNLQRLICHKTQTDTQTKGYLSQSDFKRWIYKLFFLLQLELASWTKNKQHNWYP